MYVYICMYMPPVFFLFVKALAKRQHVNTVAIGTKKRATRHYLRYADPSCSSMLISWDELPDRCGSAAQDQQPRAQKNFAMVGQQPRRHARRGGKVVYGRPHPPDCSAAQPPPSFRSSPAGSSAAGMLSQ